MPMLTLTHLLFLAAGLVPHDLSNANVVDPARQDAAQVADNRAEVKQMIASLQEHVDKRGKEDPQAIGVIDKLILEFKKSGPKDREAIVKGLDRCFQAKRQESSEGVPDNGLFIAACAALGEMAPESVKVIASHIGSKQHKKDAQLQRALILRLGKTRAEEGRKLLMKLLDDPENAIIAAAAEALGDHEGADLKLRKESFEELLKLLMGAKNEYDADTSAPIARARYEAIAAPIITTLQRLSKHDENDPQAWQHWWNKNKKEDWDASKS